MRKILTLIIAAALLFPFARLARADGSAAGGPEKQFWKWFQENEKDLYDFEKDEERVFDRLGAAMKKVDEDLTFEIGPKEKNGKREFILSAGGIRSAFPKVESLFASAPRLPHWTFIKFRPRRPGVFDLELNGKKIRASDVTYLLLYNDKDPRKIDLAFFMNGYKLEKEKTFEQIGYLILDQVLGEYAVETKVGEIYFDGRDSKHFEESHPLAELAVDFDKYFKRTTK